MVLQQRIFMSIGIAVLYKGTNAIVSNPQTHIKTTVDVMSSKPMRKF